MQGQLLHGGAWHPCFHVSGPRHLQALGVREPGLQLVTGCGREQQPRRGALRGALDGRAAVASVTIKFYAATKDGAAPGWPLRPRGWRT